MKTISIADYKPLPSEEHQYSPKFMENKGVILLDRRPGKRPVVGLCDGEESNPETIALMEEIREFHRNEVDFVHVDYEEFTAWLTGSLTDAGDLHCSVSPGETIELDKLTDDAPIVNLVNSLFIEAIRRKASDIHFEGTGENLAVRFRIDGILLPAGDYPAALFPSISSRIKIMAHLNIMEKRRPQDGRISANIGKVKMDMRISILPITGGESIVLRIFNRRSSLFSLEELGFPKKVLADVRQLCHMPHGLVLFTGPTGSGKTTSLNAILSRMDRTKRKIITLEDPVEYSIPGINQIQVNEEIGLTFSGLLRRVLRQDPDIIMVGEIRDPETARLAVRAALTGHLVLSSLHTNDAVSSVQRLNDMGVEPYLLAAVLRGVVAQRLVRVLCPTCSLKRPPSPAELKLYETGGLKPEEVWAGRGCEDCSGTGYRGRTSLAESFIKSENIEALITAKASTAELRACLKREGMDSFFIDGLQKSLSGVTGVDEVERIL